MRPFGLKRREAINMPRRYPPHVSQKSAYVYTAPVAPGPWRLVISRWDDDLSTEQVIEFAPEDVGAFSSEEATQVNERLFKEGHSPLFVHWEDVLTNS